MSRNALKKYFKYFRHSKYSKYPMCLIVFAYKTHPRFPLIVAANRDEFYARPTQKAGFWEDHPSILAGKDLKAGGTWMGISKQGRFAALTNYRDLNSIKESAPSRGKLVKDFLLSGFPVKQSIENLKKESLVYNGFNFIAGTIDSLFYFSNQKQDMTEIRPGIHSISNAFLDTPWPKTETASGRFQKIIETDNIDFESLFEMLMNTKRYPDNQLPSTGLPLELERAVSSIFISTNGYGTRCSTLLFADTSGEMTFIERSYKPGTTEENETVEYVIESNKSQAPNSKSQT